MELIIAFVIGMILLILLAEDESLGADNERVWVNRLADQSRARGSQRRRCRYVRAGYVYESVRK